MEITTLVFICFLKELVEKYTTILNFESPLMLEEIHFLVSSSRAKRFLSMKYFTGTGYVPD